MISTRFAHLCSVEECTAMQHWLWPGLATIPNTSSSLVWLVTDFRLHRNTTLLYPLIWELSDLTLPVLSQTIKTKNSFIKKKKKKSKSVNKKTLQNQNCQFSKPSCDILWGNITKVSLKSNLSNVCHYSYDLQPLFKRIKEKKHTRWRDFQCPQRQHRHPGLMIQEVEQT